MKIGNPVKLIISVFVCELAGVVGSFFTISQIENWYSTLIKPTFSPPNWIFGPVWTTLYFLMGISVFLIWEKGKDNKMNRKDVKYALTIFGIHLVLNALWSIIFFGLHAPGWALIEIIILWCSIVYSIFLFYKISKPASYLLIPYILWVTFATFLNYSIFILNS